jgi:class 3 adenylate cyclase
VASDRYEARVRDLIADAEACAAVDDWDGVRDLAGAVLALVPDNVVARSLLDRVGAQGLIDGERRQLTVMFCDVVGSTALSHENDPELVREVLRTYQSTCDQAVRRYDGRIARYIGDGILAYFGHPVAHEDDARRGVKAGLDLLGALRPVIAEIRARYGVELAVRAAVHTGVVVLGDMGSDITPDRDAIVGDTPNLASRLQDHAAPGSLVISEQTFELVRGWFLVAPLGAMELRGFGEPVTAYTVVAETTTESRVQAQADLSPFVGRRAELEALTAAWEVVVGGDHGGVLVTGQAGVGKTRVADVLRRRVEADGAGTLIANCSTYHDTTALFPVRRLLERAAGIDARDDAEHAPARLWSVLDAVGRGESVSLLADLLELPPTSWSPAPELEPAARHEALLAALVGFLRASAERSPLLLLVDDLQWADPSTLELIGRVLSARIPGLLLVMTAREAFAPPWPSIQRVSLERLSRAELDELAQRLPEGRNLDRGLLDEAIERSDGIPFFLEELLRSSALSQVQIDDRGAAIPAALRDLLLARFAAPGVDLHLAQLLATIGGEATAPVAAAVCGISLAQVEARLAPLVDAGILAHLPGEPPSYRFRHHLLADLAYDTQLRPARERAHAAVADALRSEASVGVAAAPAVVAFHLERANQLESAAHELLRAAQEAHQLGANVEVTALIDRGLDLTAKLPVEVGRDLELHLRLTRATNISSQLGYAAPQAVEDLAAAQALVGDAAELPGYLDDLADDDPNKAEGDQWITSATGVWAALLLQGQLDECDRINDQLCERLRPDGIAGRYARAVGVSMTAFFRGDYEVSTRWFNELYTSEGYSLPTSTTIPSDPWSTSYAHFGYIHAARGDFATADRMFERAVEVAGSHPFPLGAFSSCYVLGMRASIEIMRGELDAATRTATQQRALAERHGLTFWTLIASLHFSTSAYRAGDDDAVQQALMTVAMLRTVGMHVWVPLFLGTIAGAQVERGDPVGAEANVREALAVAEHAGAHFWTPELRRVLGEARLAQGDPAGATGLRAAVDLAVGASAELLELWARTSVVRHAGTEADRAALAELLERIPLPADAPARVAARAALET